MGKVIMPKNSAIEEEIIAALQTYYENGGWMKNSDFTEQLKKVIGDGQYHSSYTKKVQMTSYYGFTEWEDFSKNTSPRRITESGKRFYEVWIKHDYDKMHDEIMYSLENVIFGRNNCGCSDSDSDIEIPPLFIRTLLKVSYLTYSEFAYLLWKMEDRATNYSDAVEELILKRNQGNVVLDETAKKYTDAKPIMMLVRWKFLQEDGKVGGSTKIVLNKRVKERYGSRLDKLKIYNVDKFMEIRDESSKILTPEWFREKAKEYPTLDEEADQLYIDFQEKFPPDFLENLTGKDLLSTIFLNPYNKDNLCRIMEYDKKNRGYFGSIKSGSASKYGLYYSPKEKSWITGTTQKPVHISEDEAINIGTQIRDYLVEGSKILAECDNLDTVDEFLNVYTRLVDVTDGYINKIWVLKYYHMIYPDFYPPIYSEGAQKIALERIGREIGANPFERLGEMKEFVNECEISNVMFNKIMWSINTDEEMDEDTDEEDITDMLELRTCLEIERLPRVNKIFPLNYIVYGAPGTGKTYSMIENALAIIDNIPLDEFRANNTDRKANVNRYKELVKNGQIVFTTFHQNYGYEEFIQGLRPDKNSDTMKFKIVDGVFKQVADRALNDTENNNYVIIIDEINRANISKIFGELITLIEEDKRWGELNEMSATLQSGDEFAVPNNLYIVGTMNSADKSISLVDVALRRRFDFVEQKPDARLVKNNVLKMIFENINESLVNELDSTDLLVGHSYFMNKEEKDLCNILNNNIIPLLYEYFYDNRKKVAKILTEAISKADAKVEIVDDKIGRLSVKDKVE